MDEERQMKLSGESLSGGAPDHDRKASSIPLQEVASLFQCGRCHVAPIKPPVYTCRNSHSTCGLCYHRANRDCSVCKEPLVGRNQVLEEVVSSLPPQTCAALNEYRTPLKESRSEQNLHDMIQDPSHLEKLERARLEAEGGPRDGSGDFSPNHSPRLGTRSWCFRPSHRPVKCPYPCDSLVTYSGLYPHFELYHAEVLRSIVNKEKCSVTEIFHEDVARRVSRCHIFFVVRLLDDLGDDKRTWKSVDLQQLARASQESPRPESFMATLSVGRLPDATAPYGDAEDCWGITIWAACHFEYSPGTYTVTASSSISPHSASYTGPLISLHHSQWPRDIYSEHGCLFLSSGLLLEMKFDEVPLKISITFHSELPVSFNGIYDIEIPPFENELFGY